MSATPETVFRLSAGTWRIVHEGMQLAPEAAVLLERRLIRDPHDLSARTKLIGFYATTSLVSAESNARREAHALWIVEHCPAAEIAGSPLVGFVGETGHAMQAARAWRADLKFGSPLSYRAVELWRANVAAHPDNPRVLGYAARFFSDRDQGYAEELRLRAKALDPSNPAWDVLQIELSTAGKQAQETPEVAETRISPELTPRARLVAQLNLVRRSFRTGSTIERQTLAEELLESAQQIGNGSECSLAIHYGRIALGLLSLERGDIISAKASLAASLDIEYSREIEERGLNMSLARELLDRGESATVMQFLQRSRELWPAGERFLRIWIEDVAVGRQPEFLFYGEWR